VRERGGDGLPDPLLRRESVAREVDMHGSGVVMVGQMQVRWVVREQRAHRLRWCGVDDLLQRFTYQRRQVLKFPGGRPLDVMLGEHLPCLGAQFVGVPSVRQFHREARHVPDVVDVIHLTTYLKIHNVGAMVANDPYIPPAAARRLHRAGEWDTALALLAGRPDEDVAELRAQILVDRHWWRLDDPSPAQAAVDVLDTASPQALFLGAQLAYTRILFRLDPLADDAQTAGAGFQAATHDKSLRAWGTFWLGVVADNVHHDPVAAGARYAEALELCRQEGDLLLESYVVRHFGGQAIERDRAQGEMLLRRSLHLRSALGARPQVAAAQAALAGELPDGPEREMLLEAAAATADELGLTWLSDALSDR
jgi:hypothetical protein